MMQKNLEIQKSPFYNKKAPFKRGFLRVEMAGVEPASEEKTSTLLRT